VWKWGAKSGGLGDSRGAESKAPRCRVEGAAVEHHRIEAPKASRAVDADGGAVPLPRNFFSIFELKKMSSGLPVHSGYYFLQSIV